jgi:hypothetical protein
VRHPLAILLDTLTGTSVLLDRVLDPLKDASFNSYGSASGCLPNTRVDLLVTIGEWLQDTEGPSVFWLSGLAGTGAYYVSVR